MYTYKNKTGQVALSTMYRKKIIKQTYMYAHTQTCTDVIKALKMEYVYTALS